MLKMTTVFILKDLDSLARKSKQSVKANKATNKKKLKT